MNDRRTPLQLQLEAALALLDRENGKRAKAGEPGLGAGGEDGLTALLLSARMENKRLKPLGETPPAGDLKSATAAETASKPAAVQNWKRRRLARGRSTADGSAVPGASPQPALRGAAGDLVHPADHQAGHPPGWLRCGHL